MTDRDEIELPPLPPFGVAPIADEQTVRDYARAAVLADRERRAGQAQSVGPKVHSRWIELFPDGAWTTGPGLASYQNTSTVINICWTNDGRVWIGSKRNRELAATLRSLNPKWFRDATSESLNAAADALDGGER
jgi:hypothetical protein